MLIVLMGDKPGLISGVHVFNLYACFVPSVCHHTLYCMYPHGLYSLLEFANKLTSSSIWSQSTSPELSESGFLDEYPHLFSKLSYSLEIGIVRTRRCFYNGRLGNNIFRK